MLCVRRDSSEAATQTDEPQVEIRLGSVPQAGGDPVGRDRLSRPMPSGSRSRRASPPEPHLIGSAPWPGVFDKHRLFLRSIERERSHGNRRRSPQRSGATALVGFRPVAPELLVCNGTPSMGGTAHHGGGRTVVQAALPSSGGQRPEAVQLDDALGGCSSRPGGQGEAAVVANTGQGLHHGIELLLHGGGVA